MKFFNMMRKFGGYMEAETGGEGAGGGGTPAPAAPAPAPAPAAPAAETAPVETPAAPEETPVLEAMGYAQFADNWKDKPAVALAVNFVAEAGIAFDDPAVTLANEQGDFTLLEALLAQKNIPGSDKMLAILKAESESFFAAQAAEQERTTATVKGILGEQFEEKWEWARSNFAEDERAAFNDMFQEGGHKAVIAALAMNAIYDQHSGASVPAANPTADIAPAAPSAGKTMDRRAFAEATNELQNKYGYDYANTAEYQALVRQRQAARNRGI